MTKMKHILIRPNYVTTYDTWLPIVQSLQQTTYTFYDIHPEAFSFEGAVIHLDKNKIG